MVSWATLSKKHFSWWRHQFNRIITLHIHQCQTDKLLEIWTCRYLSLSQVVIRVISYDNINKIIHPRKKQITLFIVAFLFVSTFNYYCTPEGKILVKPKMVPIHDGHAEHHLPCMGPQRSNGNRPNNTELIAQRNQHVPGLSPWKNSAATRPRVLNGGTATARGLPCPDNER